MKAHLCAAHPEQTFLKTVLRKADETSTIIIIIIIIIKFFNKKLSNATSHNGERMEYRL